MNSYSCLREESFQEYSFEHTIDILRAKYDQCNIVLVAPSHVERGGFSCFRNFTLNLTFYGAVQACTYCHFIPSTSFLYCVDETNGHACEYLVELLSQLELRDRPLHLIGFSKGGVVLNQFVSELGRPDVTGPVNTLFSMVETMHWIDSGNGSLIHALPVGDPTAITRLSSYRTQVFIHTTPFQIKSTQRPWIKQEVETFTALLKQHEIRVQSLSYFKEQDARDLNTHFQVLTAFKT